MTTISLLAKDHNLNLRTIDDAMSAISTGLNGCIFTADDISDQFFNLNNGLAGEVFQKFVNYQFRACFVISNIDALGARVVELAREHRRHPTIRFYDSIDDAKAWLVKTDNQ